ncbi:TRAP transporter substrate-binding protein [Halomonas elongata]|uniref:TRAP transporter substrate-binding protein n=1 Tax=Halomonas elongata TaxID=2746 RepID=UPI0038D4694E
MNTTYKTLISAVFSGCLLGFSASASAQTGENPVGWGATPESDGQVIMKMGYSNSISWSTLGTTLRRFGQLVSIYSDNQIKPQIYPGGQLGSEREMIQQAQQGALQVTMPAANNLAPLAPTMNIFVLPYIVDSTDKMNNLQDELGPMVTDRVIDEAGVRIVGWENSGWRNFFYNADEPISKPASLQQFKMRVPQNPIMIATYEAWGANPTPVNWVQTYNALEQGVVQGGDSPIRDIVGAKFTEVVNRVTTLHYNMLIHPIVVSERWYQSLDDSQQKAVLRAGREATEYMRWWQPLREEQWWQQARDEGLTISAIEDESEWKRQAQALWSEFVDSLGSDGQQLLDEAKRINEQYEQSH